MQRMYADYPGESSGVQPNPSSFKSSMLMQAPANASLTGVTAETVLLAIPIPANIMGLNGAIRVNLLATFNATANLKTLKLRFGGNTVATSTKVFQGDNGGNAANITTNITSIIIQNAGNTSAQFSNSDSKASTTPVNQSAVDTTKDQYLLLTGTLAVAGDSININSFNVEVLPSA